MLDTPTPQELFPEPGGDGRVAPHEEPDDSEDDYEGEPDEGVTKKVTGMTQECWNKMTMKERSYFLLTVSWEACVYEDEEQMGRIANQMKMLVDEINNEKLALVSGASSSHHDAPRPEQSQNIEECEETKPSS